MWSGHLELGLVGEGVLGVDRCGTAVVVAGLETFHVDLPHVLVQGPGDPTLGRPAPLKTKPGSAFHSNGKIPCMQAFFCAESIQGLAKKMRDKAVLAL